MGVRHHIGLHASGNRDGSHADGSVAVMSFLRLSSVEKTYPDGTPAVKGVSVDVEDGEFVVLLGPSGCGKTTTLRMVAGLETCSAGKIELAGVDVTSLRPSQRDV